MSLPHFLNFRSHAPVSAATAAAEKLAAALALAEKCEARALAAEKECAALKEAITELETTLDAAAVFLKKKETALSEATAALTERETALAAATAALAEMPEKVKAEAIALAAASGIHAGGTPPIPSGSFTGSTPAPISLEAFRALAPVEKMAFSTAGGRISHSQN